MVASPQVPTYDFQPAMSAQPLNDTLQDAVNTNTPDLIVLNYANPDMVGHTGDFGAVIEALETVDQCLRETVDFLQQNGYACLVIADHGNADYMVNPDGSPNTAHTKNPVPVFLLDEGNEQQIRSGRLADVAPTLLELMGCRKPEAMSGQSLMIQQS
jgi:2,3-bisphosphoglycerate-independent phosphoglycerate mutase